MASELQTFELLASNFFNLRNLKTLDEKCTQLLETLRLTGWRKVSLSFIDGKYETKKTLFAGFTPEMIQAAEGNRLPAAKRKELLSSAVERWRIPPFYYLPWRDEKARLILTGGISTEIPINLKRAWHPRDLLYAPFFLDGRPVAILTLDDPVDPAEPSKVILRVPTIIYSMLLEIINRYYDEEFAKHYRQIQQAIIDMGTVGLIELDASNKIVDVNLSAEQILKKPKNRLLNLRFEKIPADNWYEQVNPLLEKAETTLEPQSAIIAYTPIQQTHALEIHLLPIHRMYDYIGMLCTFTLPENSAIFQYYRSVIDNLAAINNNLQGDPPAIQMRLIELLGQQYKCTYPRLYILNSDQSQLNCIYSYDPRLQDLAVFTHEFNRNSLAANAIIENQVMFTSIREQEIRDLRRIWDYLGTKAAVAIPVNVSPTIRGALVCDVDVETFILDDTNRLSLSFIGNLIALTLKTALNSPPKN